MTKMRCLKSYLVGPILVSGSAIIKGCRTFIWLQTFKGSKIHTDSQRHVAQAKSVLGMATVMLIVFFKAIGWNIRLVVAFNFFVEKKHSKKKLGSGVKKRYERGKRRGENVSGNSQRTWNWFSEIFRVSRCWWLNVSEFTEVLGKVYDMFWFFWWRGPRKKLQHLGGCVSLG